MNLFLRVQNVIIEAAVTVFKTPGKFVVRLLSGYVGSTDFNNKCLPHSLFFMNRRFHLVPQSHSFIMRERTVEEPANEIGRLNRFDCPQTGMFHSLQSSRRNLRLSSGMTEKYLRRNHELPIDFMLVEGSQVVVCFKTKKTADDIFLKYWKPKSKESRVHK